MAFGISAYKQTIIPLNDYDADHYLTLLYNAMLNQGWHISYFNHDGLIAYTNISFESYSEEISVRIIKNKAVIKSECVGFQGFFTDYGKNAKNLDRLFNELTYTDAILNDSLQEKTQELMNSIPEKQFINLAEPPMAGKEKLHDFFNIFLPQRDYFFTPILVIINVVVYILTVFFMLALMIAISKGRLITIHDNPIEKAYLYLGFSGRASVLHGQVWRLITNTFLHFSILHLVGNMIALIYIGSMVESKIGKWSFLILYLLTGICASMTSVIWHFNGISGGASGAIFGLFGVLLALASTDFYERNTRRAILISTAIFVAINIAPISKGIDHAAHFGGLISGYIFGWICYLGIANKYKFSQKWSILLGSALTLVYVIGCVIMLPDYKINDYIALVKKVEHTERDIKRSYYLPYGKNPRDVIDTFKQRNLPLLKELGIERKQLANFQLPAKLKRDADARSKIINLEYQEFELNYKEIAEGDYSKYKPQLDSLNNNISDLRSDIEENNQ